MTTTSDSSLPVDPVSQVQPVRTVQTSSDRLWSVLCHLSYFFGFALLSFLFPLTVFLVMRSDSPYVTHHAKEALNFHLSILIYALCCVPLCFIVIGVPLLIIIGLGGVICSIVAAVKASDGVFYQYPFAIRFVR
jgi:uncharacterized Tic20 family protein